MTADQTDTDPVSILEAAELLGRPYNEVFREVFERRLKTVAAPSGRRMVPRSVIEERLRRPQPA